MPLLNSIPSNVCELNVTMGMPMNYNPVFNLFDCLFTLHETSFRLKNIGTNQIRVFHYHSILKIINNPYITTLYINLNPEKHTGVINIKTQEILNSNKALFTLDELEALFFGQVEFFNSIKPVFKTWHKPGDALQCFNNILNVLKDTFIQNKNTNEDNEIFHEKIELEYIFNYSLIIKRINTLLDDYDIVNSIPTLRKIFNQITSVMNIPFFGEPLRGVQIMGMLETRTLDFENIILLSANEGLIPSGKNTNSFIPFDIKKEFNIPTYKDKDAVFAYHFYRLLQRCQNITLLYNTESDQLGSGDKSRFITQLIHELPKYNPNITIEEKLLSVPPVKDTVDFSINIPKTGDVINKVKEVAVSGFSPTSLNSYINCKLQFYFKEIIGLKETEEVEETIDAATLGTVIHDVLQNIYTPYINKKFSADSINQMLKQVEQKTMLAFKVIYKDGDVRYGKNLLISKVANTILKNFLRSESELLKKIEKENGSMFIKLLEEPMETNITLKTTNETIDVKLKGNVDRIDVINNTYRIIDYKTGRTEAKELKLIDWESLIHDRQYSKSFQLLIYAYLFHKKYPEIDFTSRYEITSGIYSLRQISSGLMSVATPDRDNSVIFQKTEDYIKTMLCEMFDKDIPFSQTEELNNCHYCSFVSICNR